MKTLLLLLITVGLSFSATIQTTFQGNETQSNGLFFTTRSTVINLDSSEVDTSQYIFNLSKLPKFGSPDTMGFAFMECKDSTGTDTVHVGVYWQWNSDPAGQATWQTGDSMTINTGTTTSTYAVRSKAVVNTNGWGAIRFYIKNQAAPNVAKKSACRYVQLNRKENAKVVK